MKLTNEQKVLLNLLGHNLFGTALEPMSDVDWNGVVKESISQTVFSVAFNRYTELDLPTELAEKVKKHLLKHVLSNADCFKNHSYLHSLMTKHGIRYVVLKGAASARYYPDMMLRSMGDVDFYVAQDQFDDALEIMKAEGFIPDKANHPSHVALAEGRRRFELHFKPVGYHEGEIGDMFLRAWENILDDSSDRQTQVCIFCCPSEFHHGFILLTHFHSHLVTAGVGIRHLIDWAVFANSFTDSEFRERFEAGLKEFGLWKLAQMLSLAAFRHLGMPYKSWMGNDVATADELLEDVLYGGNFGRKDRQRAYEGLMISDANTRISSKNSLRNLFTSVNSIVDRHWRSAKRFPILYPIGWVVFSLRFLFRLLLGKRKMNIFDTVKKGTDRADLYERLEVFKSDGTK